MFFDGFGDCFRDFWNGLMVCGVFFTVSVTFLMVCDRLFLTVLMTFLMVLMTMTFLEVLRSYRWFLELFDGFLDVFW